MDNPNGLRMNDGLGDISYAMNSGTQIVMDNPICLRMNGGSGDISYAMNSGTQANIINSGRSIVEETISEMYYGMLPQSVTVAELGCSSGPNALMVISRIIDVIGNVSQAHSRPMPEFQVFLNDLPDNDFNTLFRSLAGFQREIRASIGDRLGTLSMVGVPGSFYGRLFPSKSLHFVHSSSSLHWLSQAPKELNKRGYLNKGEIYISKTTPPSVADAYLTQFQRDFSLFLRSRSEEIIYGGRMVLTFLGRKTQSWTVEACQPWELIVQALRAMVLEGVIDEWKLDTFNAPYFVPSVEEVKLEIEKEGSFDLLKLNVSGVNWDPADGSDHQQTSAQRVAKVIRAVAEPILADHFGQGLMDTLFYKYENIVEAYMQTKSCEYTVFGVSLVKKNTNL